jgi:adenosine/AMP kinase
MELKTVAIEKPTDMNFILGQSHFIKTVEDVYEAMVTSVPGAKFGAAFCEASVERLIRAAGTDDTLVELAKRNARAIACGHTFIIMMKGCYPINVLNAIKAVPEVCSIFCATANDTEVVVAETTSGRGIMGVIDGGTPLGIEGPENVKKRKEFLRKIGYKM